MVILGGKLHVSSVLGCVQIGIEKVTERSAKTAKQNLNRFPSLPGLICLAIQRPCK